MQREIKFRIFDKEVGKWLCEDSQYLVMDGSKVLPAPWSTLSFDTNDEDFVIQQYTGLKDKNGKEIYEGDILLNRTRFSSQTIYEIRYDSFAFFCFAVGQLKWLLYPPFFESEKNLIVGNIFETPELLKNEQRT